MGLDAFLGARTSTCFSRLVATKDVAVRAVKRRERRRGSCVVGSLKRVNHCIDPLSIVVSSLFIDPGMNM